MRSKQLKDWGITELEDFCFAIQYVYTYLDKNDKEEKEVLNKSYDKIVEWINNGKRGVVMNPSFLRQIDKKGK